ncbi:LuxR family transcriptional regulator [Rhizobium leguminosarum bv. viciae]|nr:LuxR family transcriptional regulator [Rhizobium leguminosarum bv. viciae]
MSIVPDIHITPREMEVLHWMAEGKTASEIGTILTISYITVNQHIRNAKDKFGVFKDTALVAQALRHHIIS